MFYIVSSEFYEVEVGGFSSDSWFVSSQNEIKSNKFYTDSENGSFCLRFINEGDSIYSHGFGTQQCSFGLLSNYFWKGIRLL